MPADIEPAFREDDLFLKDYVQLRCRATWEAWELAKKETAAAAARPDRIFRVNVGWETPQSRTLIARAREAQARQALNRDLYDALNNGALEVIGVPEGGHEDVRISSAMLTNIKRFVDFSSIVVSGKRRFDFVRVRSLKAASETLAQTIQPLSAPNVIRMERSHTPSGRSTAVTRKTRKRGPKAEVGPRVKAAMLADLRGGKLTIDQLDGMVEEAMAARYKASRDVCRKARELALSEFKLRQIATIDK